MREMNLTYQSTFIVTYQSTRDARVAGDNGKCFDLYTFIPAIKINYYHV